MTPKQTAKKIICKDILDLAGKFKPSSKKPLLKAREAIEKKYLR